MRKYDKEFRFAHPETIGEQDSHYDLSNYADWLENRIEELERKAWECSVEMMEEYFRLSDEPDTYVLSQAKRVKALGYKYSAYKLREAFGFPTG